MRGYTLASAIILCALAAISGSTALPQTPDSTSQATRNPKSIEDLVYGNRILYDQGVLDGFGHISVRDDKDPQHFLLSRSLAPALVTTRDIVEYDLEGAPIGAGDRTHYLERFIHAAIYRARPDVMAVVHSHSPSLIPFGVTGTTLRPIYHMTGFLGAGAEIFDIRDVAGATDMLISNNKLADALAQKLGTHAVVLLRGHGSVMVGNSIPQAVYRSIYTEINARLQSEALQLGRVTYLSPEEAAKAAASNEPLVMRPWELWKARIGKVE